MPSPIRLSGERVTLSELGSADAPFILELLNQRSFIEHIGDRGVRTFADAEAWIDAGPRAMYAAHGHGLYRIGRLDDDEPLGICGLIRREVLALPDLGYALIDRHAGAGYALEAARLALADGVSRLAIHDVLAIVSPGNARSVALLGKLGFCGEGHVDLGAPIGTVERFCWMASDGPGAVVR
jgi:RimJ/RimL family protein N-acetyltransferase